jgi:hypothetical protein
MSKRIKNLCGYPIWIVREGIHYLFYKNGSAISIDGINWKKWYGTELRRIKVKTHI